MGRKEKFIERMLYWCNEADLGYDQANRWDIRDGGECDCSSLVYWCLWEAGYGTKPANPYAQVLYTGTLDRDLQAMGFTKIPNDGNPQAGDVLLNDTNHVAVCTARGQVSQASIDENGHATGGQSGDQTGAETNTRSYYNYPWNAYYRPPQDKGTTTTIKGDKVKQIYNGGGDVYRYYNTKTGEHFLAFESEGKTLKSPWKKEGKAFTAPKGGTVPIYRMYNPNDGLHMYTASFKEAQDLEKAGWLYEGSNFSGKENGTPVYRVYNKSNGDHLFTTDKAEVDSLVKKGLKNEGAVWYV